jgi:hypothetical protein
MLLLTGLALLPWAARNRAVLGRWIWTTTNSGITQYDGFNPDATGASDQRFIRQMPELNAMDEVNRQDYLSAKAQAFIRRYPQRAMELAAVKVARTWSPVPLSAEYSSRLYWAIGLGYSLPLDVLALVGLWRGRMARSVKVYLLVPAIYFTIVHAASVGSLRYRLPVEPTLAVLAGVGIVALMPARLRNLKRDDGIVDQ